MRHVALLKYDSLNNPDPSLFFDVDCLSYLVNYYLFTGEGYRGLCEDLYTAVEWAVNQTLLQKFKNNLLPSQEVIFHERESALLTLLNYFLGLDIDLDQILEHYLQYFASMDTKKYYFLHTTQIVNNILAMNLPIKTDHIH